ncbi:MAG: SRPBCC family protein [Actinomycetota bacterium]|nr:SRPBCC family protein [Acidimicrobiales bacterium]MEC8970164.1 SRPBCC family protein [Actinomycetota bacterium]MEC8982811.1 SRPBCC family protein [Actinomycetota bacterium]MEC9449854.1 SRPBCC family protein [Actinomycetota bacterium]MED5166080.1 SRPBCC family protein [Actinomycetota bacterium]
MELNNDFEVAAPIDRVWDVLTDVERIAPCLPGAQLQEVEGDEFRGVVKVKVGPITAQYKGAASFVERDDAGHRAVLRAEGRDTRGAGNAAADITALLEAVDGGTRVTVTTDLTVTGKVAQFGRGVMADVSRKLMGQFADNLSDLISTADGEAAAEAGSTPEDESSSETETVRVVDSPEAEAIDLLGTAGAPVLKRLVSTLVVLAVVVVLVVWVLG